MVETVYDLCQPFNVYNGVSHETGSKFFRKHDSDQNAERTQPKLFSHEEP